MVGHEEGIEPSTLERLRQPHEVREVEIGVGPGTGIAPCAGMEADRPHEGAEMKLLSGGHVEGSLTRARNLHIGAVLARALS